MPEDVILEYKRVDIDRCTGRLRLLSDGGVHLHMFESVGFKDMLKMFARALQENPEARAVWQRTDRDGLVPYVLDAEVTNLFRVDPVRAIESMCPPSISPSTVLKRIKEQEAKPVGVSVRACYDVLADAFGDDVYTRARYRENKGHYVECPCCGHWNSLGAITYHCVRSGCPINLVNPIRRLANNKWAAFAVSELLATSSPRFYLPRAWNDGRSWITWADLNEKYNEYEREKGQVT